MPLRSSDTAVNKGQFHIFQGRQVRNQVEPLKNKANFLISDFRQLVILHGGHILAVQIIRSGSRHIQASQHIHQRRLSRTGMPDDCHKFTFFYLQAHMIQCADFILPRIVNLTHIPDTD